MKQQPIKRNEHIVKLSREHHFALLFSWKIRQGLKYQVPEERMRKYVQYFWQHYILPHFREEEDILFAGSLESGLVQTAIEEHKQILKQVSELADHTGNGVNEKLAQLSSSMDNHVRYEEREVFPYLERTLSPEQLNAIGKQLSAPQLAHPQDDYEDEFWVRK